MLYVVSRCRVVTLSRCRVVALWRCRVVALSRCAFCNVWCVVCGVHMHVYVERECAKRATEAAAAAEAETEGCRSLSPEKQRVHAACLL